jgi:hypothetical protein
MIRTLNIACLAIAGLVCLFLYRSAEEARVAAVDLKATRSAIVHEKESIVVLGAEWARLTQPQRIQALVRRHLDLTDKPQIELSSLSLLPSKNPPLLAEGVIRNAQATTSLRAAPAILVRTSSGR